MRKTILMLINGFGIEQKGSTEIYSSSLMPNMDVLTKSCLFGSLQTSAGDINNGYRLFSVPEKGKNAEDKIDNMIFDKTLVKNEVLNNISTTLTENNKLHIFYILNTGTKLHQVKEFLKLINPNKDKKVFIHLVFTSTSTADYDIIKKAVSKISFEMSEYGKVGFVVGKNKINTDDVLRTFYKEYGEHWNESAKKIDILKKDIINPEDASVFFINNGFSLAENDSVLFLNFEDIDMERFYNEFTKIALNKYSLYEFKDGVQNIFVREKSETSSLASIIENYKINLLVLTTQSRINDINFYLNGLKKIKSPNLTYAINDLSLFSTKDSVINLIEGSNYDGIILDFDIGLYKTVQEIKDTLSKIDAIIKPISDASREKNYTFIISSLYGMYASVTDGVVPKVINFSGKVPCIYQNNEFTKGAFSLNSGNTYGLGQTFLTNICDEVKSNKLVHQLNKVEKMLSKK